MTQEFFPAGKATGQPVPWHLDKKKKNYKKIQKSANNQNSASHLSGNSQKRHTEKNQPGGGQVIIHPLTENNFTQMLSN